MGKGTQGGDNNPNLFKEGNQLWRKAIGKNGRPRKIQTPEDLAKEAISYFEDVDGDPFTNTETHYGSDNKVTRKVEKTFRKPYTLTGFLLHLGVSSNYITNFKNSKPLSITEETYSDFITVINWIEETIRTQKFAGAAAGIFKENIIARDLGLVDKQESTNTNIDATPTKEEIKDIDKALEDGC